MKPLSIAAGLVLALAAPLLAGCSSNQAQESVEQQPQDQQRFAGPLAASDDFIENHSVKATRWISGKNIRFSSPYLSTSFSMNDGRTAVGLNDANQVVEFKCPIINQEGTSSNGTKYSIYTEISVGRVRGYVDGANFIVDGMDLKSLYYGKIKPLWGSELVLDRTNAITYPFENYDGDPILRFTQIEQKTTATADIRTMSVKAKLKEHLPFNATQEEFNRSPFVWASVPAWGVAVKGVQIDWTFDLDAKS